MSVLGEASVATWRGEDSLDNRPIQAALAELCRALSNYIEDRTGVLPMIESIRELYGAGVDCGVESFQGEGVLAWVVDAGNRRVEKRFAIHELEAVSEWLFTEAARQRETPSGTQTPRDLLAELANARRKDSKRVSVDERHERHRPAAARSN